jgi:carbon starvation protein CstA
MIPFSSDLRSCAMALILYWIIANALAVFVLLIKRDDVKVFDKIWSLFGRMLMIFLQIWRVSMQRLRRLLKCGKNTENKEDEDLSSIMLTMVVSKREGDSAV